MMAASHVGRDGQKVSFTYVDDIAKSAHKPALDDTDRYNMLQKTQRPLRSTNPCWGGETRILTKDGPVSFMELANGPSKIKVMTREDDGTLSYRTMENPGITQEDADIVCLVVVSKQTGECAALRCTPEHNVYRMNGSIIQRCAVRDVTPGTSLCSLYKDGSMWEQTVGVSVAVDEVPEVSMEGTGHPKPGILPISLASRKGKSKKKKGVSEGFIAADGTVPEAPATERTGRFTKWFRRNHTVLAVMKLERAPVYNGMVETTHNYFVECGEGHYIMSANCGEQALCTKSCTGFINMISIWINYLTQPAHA